MPARLSSENREAQCGPGERPAPGTSTFPVLTEGECVPNWNSVGAPGVGIDRLSVSFPVRDWLDLRRWAKVEHRQDGGWSAQVTVGGLGLPSVMVGLRTVAGKPWGKVECNPARFADPDGCSLLDPRQLPAALTVMCSAAAEVTEPALEPGDWNVKRVDVARDFRGVMSPALYVEGLGPIKRPYARRSFTYNDPGRANAQTLFVGSKAGGVRLYDQHEAYSEKGAPAGSIRWETEARRGWLEKAGVRRVADLDAVAVDRLAAERWEWSKMGSPVTGPVNAVQLLERHVQAGEISRAVAYRLAGEMLFRSFGFGDQARTSQWRYRAVADEVGLTATALWSDDLSRQAVGRLDFESGAEVLALA